MKIILAGGTGFIGKSLGDNLAKAGHELYLLTRNPEKHDSTDITNISYIKWNARSIGDWEKEIDGADTVINLTGEPIAEKRWTKFQKEWILNSRIDSTKALVLAISHAERKPSTLVNASAVGYYGDIKSGEVDESHEPGDDFLADVCQRWEKEAQGAVKHNVRVVTLRTGVVLEKDGGALKKMLSAFKAYAGGTPGSGKQWVPWIHREDVVRAIEFIVANAAISGAVNITAPNPVTMKELAVTIGKVIDKPMWAPVPSFMVKAALGEMANMLLTGQKAIPRKLLDAGFEFKFPELRSALEAILL